MAGASPSATSAIDTTATIHRMGMAAYPTLAGWPVDMAGESPVPYLPTMATTVSVARTALEALLQDAPAKETPYADFLDISLGTRSTIVGLQPSAVPNFAKSLIVVARRGFSDAA